MTRSAEKLRQDALAIWRAGVAAVDSQRLVRENVRFEHGLLHLGEEMLPIDGIRRLAVVGAGKAGAGMAAGVEQALGEALMARLELHGWVNVPSDCVRPLSRIRLHGARPASRNEPTEDGVAGSQQILEIVSRLGPDDVCLCLFSGGGSALLPAPRGVSLADKLAVTRFLSAAGANIEELNTVRKQLSRIKGGGLARACRAGRLIGLIISDVMGDPLDVIASGPTVPDPSTPADALAVLHRFGAERRPELAGVLAAITSFASRSAAARTDLALPPDPTDWSTDVCRVRNFVIGNNALAVDAAGIEAESRGYSHAMVSARASEGPAEEVGRHLADMAVSMRDQPGPDCLISGGEPVVRLVESGLRGKGGRNQQLVLAALERLIQTASPYGQPAEGICLLSGGTDGEDGPTDAAGALLDAAILARTEEMKLRPGEFLDRNDAYTFFQPLEGLIITGPTHTNVGDLRVVVVAREG